MPIEFENPLTAGTVLVREDIRSQNFVPGVSGWRIEADGSAEFNDIIIRGGQTIGGDALYYSGAPAPGNLVLSISAAGGTDQFGNVYPPGLGVFASGSVLKAQISLTGGPDSQPGFTAYETATNYVFLGDGAVQWGNTGVNAFQDPEIQVLNTGSGTDPRVMILGPGRVDGPGSSNARIRISSAVGGRASVDIDAFNGVADLTLSGLVTSYAGNQFTTYVPVVGNAGTATWTTRTGWYQKFGKFTYFNAYLVVNAAGSGTSPITLTAPVDIDRTTRQQAAANCEMLTRAGVGPFAATGAAVALTTGSGNVFDRLRVTKDAATARIDNVNGEDLGSGTVISVQGWIREV